MSSAILNAPLTVPQGTTWANVFRWRADGVLVDLSGYTATFIVREHAADTTSPIVYLTTSAGITLGGALGTATVALTATQTAALTAGVYVYELWLIAGDGVTKTSLSSGSFTVTVTPMHAPLS